MKKNLAYLIIAILIIVFLILVSGIYSRKTKAKKAFQQIEILPAFNLPSLNGELFYSDAITTGPILITYFHPECEHCQYEISSIFSSKLPEEDLKIILISNADPVQVKSFIRQFDLRNDSLLWVLCDTSHVFSKMYQTQIIPTNYLYDKDRHLMKIVKGEINVGTILKNLR